MFDFNDKWGSYRGYIWRRVTGLYGELPFVQKIFGHGNESIRSLMDDRFYDEMLQVTGTVYDNAHNEYLQYLVTQGLLGMLSYVGVVVTAAIAGVNKEVTIYIGTSPCRGILRSSGNVQRGAVYNYPIHVPYDSYAYRHVQKSNRRVAGH